MISLFSSNRFWFCTISFLLFLVLNGSSLTAAVETGGSDIDDIRNLIRSRIETRMADLTGTGDKQIYANQALPLFYERRAFLPAWSDAVGPLPVAAKLAAALNAISSDGLRPKDYHLDRINACLEAIRPKNSNAGLPPEKLADLDLLLTDAFLLCGAHMVKGRINPESIDPEWFASLREIDLPAVLEKAIAGGRISETLLSLRPDHAEYLLLVNALETYRNIATAGGWGVVPGGPSLKTGDISSRIPAIRNRLILTGDLAQETDTTDVFFDDQLSDAVIRFQTRHGIDADGVVGPETLTTMNVSVSRRIDQILLNLERWRWLPQNLGDPHIIVNIADFSLTVREHGASIIEMRAIVGRPYRRTPVFSNNMTYLVINPSWNIPHKIAVTDILSAVRKNPEYLSELNVLVYRGWGADSQFIDSNSIDWTALSPQHFPYHLRQEPGPKNALGTIKFMFPNKFNVYIHDTPSRDLFQKTSRSFSSGCIRIENPIVLATYLLSENPAWTSDKIESAIATGIEQTVSLPSPLPVHILYWTAWTTPDNVMHFRKDIYGRDDILLKALLLPAPENK